MDELFDLSAESENGVDNDNSAIHWPSQTILIVASSVAEALLDPFLSQIGNIFNVTFTHSPKTSEISQCDLVLVSEPLFEEQILDCGAYHKPTVCLFEPQLLRYSLELTPEETADSHAYRAIKKLKILIWMSHAPKLAIASAELSREAIVTLHADLRFAFANQTAKKLFGLPEDLSAGVGLWDVVKDPADPLHSSLRTDVFHAKEIEVIQGENGTSEKHIRLQKLGSDQKFLSFLCTDITEQVHLREDLESERALVVQAGKLAAMGEIVAKISHEINNPLTLIAARCEQMQELVEGKDFLKLPELLEKQHRQIERIKHIVRSLSSHSRNAGQDPLIPTALKQILESVTELLKFKIDKRQISVLLPSEEQQKNLVFCCRASEMSQIFVNILNKSVDAVEKSEHPWVKVEAEQSNNQVVIRFLDSGPGVPLALRQNIWKPFFTTKSPDKGTGLGLPISKTIAQNHHGTLDLQETPSGTCFILTLPLAPPLETADNRSAAQSNNSTEVPPSGGYDI